MSATGERTAGFTLLETLTALALTALVGALAFPVLQGAIEAAAFAQSKAEVVSDLRVARARALQGGAPVAFAVAADGRGYGWSGGPPRRLANAARLQSPSIPIAFYPDGSAAGGPLGLQAGGRRADVLVSPTGAVWVAPTAARR